MASLVRHRSTAYDPAHIGAVTIGYYRTLLDRDPGAVASATCLERRSSRGSSMAKPPTVPPRPLNLWCRILLRNFRILVPELHATIRLLLRGP
jgi:hypothetical protein